MPWVGMLWMLSRFESRLCLRIMASMQVSLKYAFESKNDLFLILDLMTGGECYRGLTCVVAKAFGARFLLVSCCILQSAA